jgi:hypothetical protein
MTFTVEESLLQALLLLGSSTALKQALTGSCEQSLSLNETHGLTSYQRNRDQGM